MENMSTYDPLDIVKIHISMGVKSTKGLGICPRFRTAQFCLFDQEKRSACAPFTSPIFFVDESS